MPTPPPPPLALYRSMAPPVAEAPAAAYPSSTGPATIELTINGALYRWSGSATFSGGLWSPPGAVWNGKWLLVTPAPAPAAVTGYVDPAGKSVSSVSAGAAFVIHGRGFGTATGQARLDAGAGSGMPFGLPISSWSDTAVAVTMPAAGALPASATVTVQTAAGAVLTGPLLSVTPAPPVAPQISGLLDSLGQPRSAFAAGERVTVAGSGFGPAPGTLQLQAQTVPTTAWSDTAVQFTVPAGSVAAVTPLTVGIITGAGRAYVSTGITIAQALASPPPESNESDPLPGPWAAEIPATVETQPFTVAGKSYALVLKVFAGAGPGSFTVNGQSVAVSITPVPVLLAAPSPAKAIHARPDQRH